MSMMKNGLATNRRFNVAENIVIGRLLKGFHKESDTVYIVLLESADSKEYINVTVELTSRKDEDILFISNNFMNRTSRFVRETVIDYLFEINSEITVTQGSGTFIGMKLRPYVLELIMNLECI